MTETRRTFATVLAGTLAALLLPLGPALAQAPERAGEGLVYLLQAESLPNTGDGVSVRFEALNGQRVVASETLAVRLGPAESVVVPVPALVSAALAGADSGERELRVFAEDLQLNAFDAASLTRYQRMIRSTRSPEVAALTGRPKGEPTSDIMCESPCGGGCRPYEDYDCDGVANITDNCTDDPNSDQADCDNDGLGDVCDFTDGVFQNSGPVKTCMTDKDSHIGYTKWEHHVEQRLVDVSSCNSPDRWQRSIRSSGGCCDVPPCGLGYTDQQCCMNSLGTSITQVGDSVPLWCGSYRNDDRCQ
jgi:hypothetical protein